MNKPLDNKGRTPKHEPRLMDRLQMQDILEPNMAKIQQQVFFNNELGIVHGDPTLFRLIMKQRPPFIISAVNQVDSVVSMMRLSMRQSHQP